MKSSKANNSILFLTTLGVYLGLVLVGATPVLGHAATTRNFEIADEIEIKDDLDKKPDDCDELRRKAENASTSYGGRSAATDEYALVVQKLVRALADSQLTSFSFIAASYPTVNGTPDITLEGAKPVLFANDSRRQIDEQLKALLAIIPNTGTKPENRFSIDFEQSASGLSTTSVFSRDDEYNAHLLFVSLKASQDLWRCSSQRPSSKTILAGTEFHHKGNQVLVVTRLPRAALDTLLSKDAK